MFKKYFYYITCFVLLIGIHSCKTGKQKVDIFIYNGEVYNGESLTSEKVNIGITDEKIVYIGNRNHTEFVADRMIDATGKIVCPGFIDPHTHADRELKKPESSHNLPFLMQGITTVVVGSDGQSFFPTSKFKTLYEAHGIGTNAVLMTGHGTLRKIVVGQSDRKASEEEIGNMQKLVQQEMDDGSFGLSTGLYYAPGSYSNTEEVIALAQVATENDGIYDTHLRDEGSSSIGLESAVQEAIEIGRQAKLPIHISHIKCLGVDVWQKSQDIINLIEKSRAEGISVSANQYPYDASATGLQSAVIPRWAESGGIDSLFIRYGQPSLKEKILRETKLNITRRGGPEKLLIVMVADSSYLGKTLLEVASMLKKEPEAAVLDILQTGSVRVASFNMTKEDIRNYMQQDWVVTGSDGNTGHPRKYGSFPRKYRKYVKEDKVIDLGFFINNSSSRTADIFKIKNRCRLLEGNFADLIIFDPENFTDKADYTDAFQYAEGLNYSIINGKIAVDNGEYNKALNGKVLSKK